MTELRHLGVATDYPGLHELLRRRQAELGVSLKVLNDISGVEADKLLMPMSVWGEQDAKRRSARALGPLTLGPLLSALGLVLIVAEDPAATARIKARSSYRPRSEPQVNAAVTSIDQIINDRIRNNRANQLAHARAQYMVKLTPEARKEIARNAARIRWQIERAEREAKGAAA